MLKLIGVLIILIGFIKKYNTIAVVLVAGIVTGLVGGLGFIEILNIIGSAFVKTRYMTLFLLTLPAIGVLERYGLRERASTLIKSIKSVTTGKVLTVYTLAREIAAAFSLRLGGHVQFIRPLVHPMAHGAAEINFSKVDEKEEDIIKGYSAAAENIGNFFGQNVFVASGGVLLVVGTLEELGIKVTPLNVSKSAIPIAIIAFIYAVIQNYMLDKRLERKSHTKTIKMEGK
ncbi:DUF969 domain-containing protein [Paramaledivibacter caminithermalis]|jgi:uncharacterized membrane protein|uniref:Uncharacterized membrane protein n=1 Tax=Paramaledivibacter caminithermalis (strain DSM 15212 / CIP 107654 / DViRD3) TaxID=1121301 RepID=A0A1M6LGM5_PARC5|nr:DUF969 domain-containing protein [Paramaledivibacter caminithermalis]SHJ70336.1 Uncharacterized membrane protein [Paramaledivibacter caminithermalis DSM 15212]